MKKTYFETIDLNRAPAVSFRTAVSLHSHTLHSREGLDFIYQAAARVPLLCQAIQRMERRCHEVHGSLPDLSRAWWTPPLAARDAWRVEVSQIEEKLALNPLVSLTDHDTIDALTQIRIIEPDTKTPVSFEWTVPYGGTFFHLGVHNLPSPDAHAIFKELVHYTSQPQAERLNSLLEWLSGFPQVLVVFNHPCWDEKGIGHSHHMALVAEFLHKYGPLHKDRPWIHAIEFNGMRSWAENHEAADLAAAFGLPVISGGDRHGREPNCVLNLTAASTFEEFIEEVRIGLRSYVLLLPQYGESLRLRILQSISDVLADDENHGLGWKRWSDRIFYLCDDGVSRSLSELWGDSPPLLVGCFVALVRMSEHRHLRGALRLALAGKSESLV